MARASTKKPFCIVSAGPKGSGYTAFAREFLPKDASVIHFVNADGGLSPLRPELARLTQQPTQVYLELTQNSHALRRLGLPEGCSGSTHEEIVISRAYWKPFFRARMNHVLF